MKAKEYNELFNKELATSRNIFTSRTFLLSQFIQDTKDMIKQRKIQAQESLMALLRERDKLWRKIAELNPKIDSEAFDKFYQKQNILIY